jgi:hypothetical protein
MDSVAAAQPGSTERRGIGRNLKQQLSEPDGDTCPLEALGSSPNIWRGVDPGEVHTSINL